MGEKKKEKDNNGGEKKGDGDKPITVVLKVPLHCEGCASKIVKHVRGFDGVETVKAEADSGKLTVIGKVDPSNLREKLHNKTNKKVDLISPQPKKEKEKEKEPKAEKKSDDKKPDSDKKSKEPPVTTAVLKLRFHCQGCIEKIHRTVSKTKGVQEKQIDKQKELVTVKGTMDVKALAENLKERLKRDVEIVPLKKEKEDNNDGGAGGGGGGKKKKGVGAGDGGKEAAAGAGGAKMEGNKMEYIPIYAHGPGQPMYGHGPGQPMYGYGPGQPIYEHGPGQPAYGHGYGQPAYGYGHEYGYGHGYPAAPLHPPQMFSDENPNACTIM